MITDIETVILLLCGICILLVIIPAVFYGNVPLPTSMAVQARMLDILPKPLPKKGEMKIYELGSGWGSLARALATQYPTYKVVGIEISIIPWTFSRIMLLLRPKKNLEFQLCNFFKTDISDCRLAVCYLAPSTMKRLYSKFYKELPLGSLILSNTFSLRGWRVMRSAIASDLYQSEIFLYERSSGPGVN